MPYLPQKRTSRLIQLDEYLIGHLGWQGLIGSGVFEHGIEGRRVLVCLLKNEGLASMVVDEIPQVFRGEGHLVDLIPLGMGTRDDVLFYSSHDGFSAFSCNC